MFTNDDDHLEMRFWSPLRWFCYHCRRKPPSAETVATNRSGMGKL